MSTVKLKQPLKNRQNKGLKKTNGGIMNAKVLQNAYSAILLTCIK